MRWRALALFALLAGCDTGPAAPVSRGWTMFDLAAAAGATPPQQVLVGVDGAPGGLPPGLFVTGPGPLIPLRPAWTEGSFSPYLTTNLWQDVPEIWVQPMYIFVTSWSADTGTVTLAGLPWVFTVGPTSRFHSPFWRVYWVEVPDKSHTYTSSDQIFAAHLPIHEGPGRLVSLVPLGTQVSTLEATAPFYAGHAVSDLKVRTQDYLDGAPIGAIDFGVNRFEWNNDLEVQEQPLFVFFSCPEGKCQMAFVPNVGGTGPLFARRPAIAPGGKPRFGSFWRLYFVTLPSSDSVRVCVPPDYQKFVPAIEDYVKGVMPGSLGFTPDSATMDQVNHHFMQVALNGDSCFKDPQSFAGCRWIDSQQAVEDNLANSIVRTGITVTCPFVGYDDQAVPLK